MDDKLEKLELLRKPFPKNKISKLPKPNKQQTEQLKVDYKCGIRCLECGGWHHPQVVHLDYVGHATVTDRFLEVDPLWNWEPFALTPEGLPALDKEGNLWIKLTICGVTRFGYGDAQGKAGGDAMKEKIGDALRNASMRFGVALDLWAKIDLHQDDNEKPSKKSTPKDVMESTGYKDKILNAQSIGELIGAWNSTPSKYKTQDLIVVKDNRKAELTPIDQKIADCTTRDGLISICETLTHQQQTEYAEIVGEKMDEFLLNESPLELFKP